MNAVTLARRGRLSRQCHDPAGSAKALQQLREAQLDALTEGVDGPLHVDIYVLTAPGQAPESRTAQALQVAASQGWHIGLTICDTTGGGSAPALRPYLSHLLDRIARGECAGLTAVSRTDFTPFDDEYEAFLHHLNDLGGFLALVSPETGL
ncbi:hypothetical protein ACLF6K_06475 [Streptomyces xanthophaeus]|uniref:hypothetical protein n=1 Tax=Streptomyces xanthophaeus TaxID=67385 RepID=UPI00398FFD1E